MSKHGFETLIYLYFFGMVPLDVCLSGCHVVDKVLHSKFCAHQKEFLSLWSCLTFLLLYWIAKSKIGQKSVTWVTRNFWPYFCNNNRFIDWKWSRNVLKLFWTHLNIWNWKENQKWYMSSMSQTCLVNFDTNR